MAWVIFVDSIRFHCDFLNEFIWNPNPHTACSVFGFGLRNGPFFTLRTACRNLRKPASIAQTYSHASKNLRFNDSARRCAELFYLKSFLQKTYSFPVLKGFFGNFTFSQVSMTPHSAGGPIVCPRGGTEHVLDAPHLHATVAHARDARSFLGRFCL